MDSLLNYQDVLNQFGASQQAVKDKASSELAEKKEKLRDLTNPFEQLGIDDFSDLFKKGVKGVGSKLLGKVGLTKESAKKLVDAHNKNGVKGVLEQIGKDRPQLLSKKVVPAGAREPTALSGAIDTSANLEDLLPSEFKNIKGVANQAIKSELSDLEPIDRLNFVSKFNELKSSASFGGDTNLKQQFNLQQARKALDFAKDGQETEGALSIASLKPQDFRELQPVIKGSIEAEKSALHPVYRQKFDDLMNERVATPSDIPDDLLRSKFNLHQQARTLDDLKNFSPSELAPLDEVKVSGAVDNIINKASTQLSQVSQLTRTTTDELGQEIKSTTNVLGQVGGSVLGRAGEIAQLAQGKGSIDAFKGVGKQEGIDQATGVAKKAVGKAIKGGAEKLGEDVGEDVAVAGTGGEDPIGDVIGAVVGLGTFLGGLFGARHLHAPKPPTAPNIGFQLGV